MKPSAMKLAPDVLARLRSALLADAAAVERDTCIPGAELTCAALGDPVSGRTAALIDLATRSAPDEAPVLPPRSPAKRAMMARRMPVAGDEVVLESPAPRVCPECDERAPDHTWRCPRRSTPARPFDAERHARRQDTT